MYKVYIQISNNFSDDFSNILKKINFIKELKS